MSDLIEASPISYAITSHNGYDGKQQQRNTYTMFNTARH